MVVGDGTNFVCAHFVLLEAVIDPRSRVKSLTMALFMASHKKSVIFVRATRDDPCQKPHILCQQKVFAVEYPLLLQTTYHPTQSKLRVAHLAENRAQLQVSLRGNCRFIAPVETCQSDDDSLHCAKLYMLVQNPLRDFMQLLRLRLAQRPGLEPVPQDGEYEILSEQIAWRGDIVKACLLEEKTLRQKCLVV